MSMKIIHYRNLHQLLYNTKCTILKTPLLYNIQYIEQSIKIINKNIRYETYQLNVLFTFKATSVML